MQNEKVKIQNGEAAALEVLAPLPNRKVVTMEEELERDLLEGIFRDHLVMAEKLMRIRNYGMALAELESAQSKIGQLARLMNK